MVSIEAWDSEMGERNKLVSVSIMRARTQRFFTGSTISRRDVFSAGS